MAFRLIAPLLTDNQQHLIKKPSLYRACVNGDKAEYWACELKIIAAYRKANAKAKL